ncbi:hypothetical protein [Shimia sp. SDUM112013]|uniref:hypothetical protein n=1 Tax=Shimia sp. SDUM112013 TaxID=3136160 RepID=UPI0032EB725B
MRFLFSLTFLVAIAACAAFPEVDQAVSDDVKKAPYPALVPVEQVLTETPTRLDENSDEAIDARVTALQRRAEALRRRPVE